MKEYKVRVIMHHSLYAYESMRALSLYLLVSNVNTLRQYMRHIYSFLLIHYQKV